MVDLYFGDCLEVMKNIPDNSIDMVLCDLPYGTTDANWDCIIPFNELWAEYNRIVKPNGTIALFAVQPFTTMLINSNISNYKYNWVWIKNFATGFQYAKFQPKRITEDICIFVKNVNETVANDPAFDDIKKYFYEQREKSGLRLCDFKKILGNNMASHYFTKGIQWHLPNEKDYKKLQSTGFFKKPYFELKEEYEQLKQQNSKKGQTYNPQGLKKYDEPKLKRPRKNKENGLYDGSLDNWHYVEFYNYPTNILEFKKDSKCLHPTQKPVDLLEYLVKTYTNEGETVLDNCMGSGSTGVACLNTGRHFIGIEKDERYFTIAQNRILGDIAS